MSICPNLSIPEVKQQFDKLIEALGEPLAYLVYARNNGNFLDKTPSGEDSKLYKDILKKVNGSEIEAIKLKASTLSTKKSSTKSFKEIKDSSLDGSNNKKLDIMLKILRHPESFKDIMTPGTFKPLQDIAKSIISKLEDLKASGLATMSLNTVDKLQVDNSTGKGLTGIAANDNAFHAIAQHSNLESKIKVLFDGISGSKLGQRYALNKVSISGDKIISATEDISQTITKNKNYYLAAIVDNPKDPVASYINYNEYTASLVGFLSEVGVDPATIAFFLQQPVIRAITKDYSQSGADISKEDSIIESYKKQLGIDQKNSKISPENLNTKDLYKNITSDINDKSQIAVLKSFIAYKKVASDYTKLVLSLRADTTPLGPMLSNGEVLLDSISDILDNESAFSFTGYRELIEAAEGNINIPKIFTENGISKPLELLRKIYPYDNDFFRLAKGIINDNLSGRRLSAKGRDAINNAAITYLTTGFDYFNPNEKSNIVKKLPKEFAEFTQKYPDLVKSNEFLKRLRREHNPQLKGKSLGIEIISFKQGAGTLSSEQITNITQSWYDLFSKYPENTEIKSMAEKLFKYSFFSNGLQFGVNSFAHFTPIELYYTHIKDSNNNTLSDYMYNMLDKTSNGFDVFVDQYFRNNWNKSNIVPRVDETVGEAITSKGVTTGYTVTNTPENKSLIIKEFEDGEFLPKRFFTKEVKTKSGRDIQLFELEGDPNVATYKATYRRTYKLGIPNKISEYMVGGLKASMFNQNNQGYTGVLIDDSANFKYETPSYITLAEISDNVDLGNFKLTNAIKKTNGDFTLEFTRAGKSYKVTLTSDGKYIEATTGKPAGETLEALYDKVLGLIEQKLCGK